MAAASGSVLAGTARAEAVQVVANMAESPAGNVMALDGRPFFAHAKTAGYLAAAELRHELASTMGVEWEAVERGLADVAGVSDAAIAEIAYCCDRLEVDGFVALTNIRGTYLAGPSWEPVFDELDRRGARLLIHPTSPACWEQTSLGRPRPMLEFFFDTTRAVVDLVLNGTIARHPDIELVVPHSGATIPMIADRVRSRPRTEILSRTRLRAAWMSTETKLALGPG